jgi:tRNA modification GTPase
MLKDTIAAIATPAGTGGIGIVRISGSGAENILRRLFRSSHDVSHFQPRRLYHGDLIAPKTGQVLDEVLISLMKGPHSFSGEDTLEIFCHGGILILESVLSAVLEAGARLAEPGEFTRRAFLNDRIDLTQAESIGDLISARTSRGLETAVAHLKGRLKEKIEFLRERLIDSLVLLETAIEFPEDVEPPSSSEVLTNLQSISADIDALLRTYEQGKMDRHGAMVVIAGKPNTGKSSLLNCLLEEKRAIVTPIPGTTRDFIEEAIKIQGMTIRLTDTAGIHPTEDEIEHEGIRMVWERLAAADGVILLFDGSNPLTDEDRDLLKGLAPYRVLPVINKTDLDHRLKEEEISACLPGTTPLWISAKLGEGIPALKESICRLVMDRVGIHDGELLISSLRQKMALEKTLKCVAQALTSLQNDLSPEFAALDVREALEALGEIGGETATEEILERIFSAFCIGK